MAVLRLDQLPEELLLQVAFHLPDSTTPKHLKSLCLTSRKLRPIAQEALHTTAKLAICCGCHFRVNALVKLLRTVLDRPDLASKVKILRFRAVRKCIEKLYLEQGFEFLEFRSRCMSRLEELGYQPNHPWWRSINNSIESAFGGLLLALLPSLTDLDFWIKDHQRGPPSSECISGLWGGMSPPQAIVNGWKNISHLVTGDTSILKCGIEFNKLTSLDLRTISIGTVLRLNGPGSLQGAENLKVLNLTASIQFADCPLVEKAEIEFSELLGALGCHALRDLKIVFINDGYHIGDDLTTELNANYFFEQLHSVQKTLETLSITLEPTEDDGELEWLVDMCQHPAKSLRGFTILKSLIVPQPFIFTTRSENWDNEDYCQPKDLPPNLEQLELLYPHEDVEEWVEGFLDESYYATANEASTHLLATQESTSTFKRLILTCREDVGMGASYFTEGIDKVWWTLSADKGIEAEVYDQLRGTRGDLAGLYENERLNEKDSIDEDDELFDENKVDENEWEEQNDIIQSRWYGLPELSNSRLIAAAAQRIAVLRCLRNTSNPSLGLTDNEVSATINLEDSLTLDALEDLLRAGFVGSRDTPEESGLKRRYFFITESEELHRTDQIIEIMNEDSMNGDGWGDDDSDDSDDSMPELEALVPIP